MERLAMMLQLHKMEELVVLVVALEVGAQKRVERVIHLL
jgi:hypothetical protein